MDGDLNKGRNYAVNYNSQVVTKYKLLDRLATLLGCNQGGSLVKKRVVLTSAINARLLRIVKDAAQWHRIGRAMHRKLSDRAADLASLSSAVPNPSNTQQDDVFHRNVNWLWGAQLSFLKSDIANAEGQMLLMAFMVNWHATVCLVHCALFYCYLTHNSQHRTPFPSDVDGFFDPITEYVPL